MSDREIILGCLQNNRNYQKLLFDKYSGVLMTVCRRYFPDYELAEDALQDGFIRIFQSLHQFNHEGSFEGWLKKVVVNVALRKIQTERKVRDWLDLTSAENKEFRCTAIDKLAEEDILTMIGLLPAGYRTVFNMYIMDGFSHKEIAKVLSITESTSRSQLVKARQMLQKMVIETKESD
jgi:RNA polymerase sigma factor (sigma-70 family)